MGSWSSFPSRSLARTAKGLALGGVGCPAACRGNPQCYLELVCRYGRDSGFGLRLQSPTGKLLLPAGVFLAYLVGGGVGLGRWTFIWTLLGWVK